MDKSNLKKYISIKDGFSIHEVNDDLFMLTDCINGDVYEINETAKLIIETIIHADSLSTVNYYVDYITTNNDIDEVDVVQFLNFLIRYNIGIIE